MTELSSRSNLAVVRDGGTRRGAERPRTDPALGEKILHVIDGDAAARTWFYDRFSPRLFRRLRARYAHLDGLDPEELLQDAFLSYFQHRSRILRHFLERAAPEERTEARLEGHLWDLACGVASNRLRSLKRHRTAPFPEFEPESDAATPERVSVARDVLVRLASCLKSSGSRVYLYYKLRFVDGLTPGEITTVTGWSRKSTYKLKVSLNEAVDRCARRLRLP